MYVTNKGTAFATIIMVYVGDLIIMSKDLNEIITSNRSFLAKFKLKDLGEIHHFLGIQFERISNGRQLFLSQRGYLKRALERFRMSDTKSAVTPMQEELCLSVGCAPASEKDRQGKRDVSYSEAVGSLLYLAEKTRPDICFAVRVLCGHVADPGSRHWIVVKRVFRYLRGTVGKGSRIGAVDGSEIRCLWAYSASDWAVDRGDRKSTSGYLVSLNGG